jgi:hypothetical protein
MVMIIVLGLLMVGVIWWTTASPLLFHHSPTTSLKVLWSHLWQAPLRLCC